MNLSGWTPRHPAALQLSSIKRFFRGAVEILGCVVAKSL
jgi:hypothetical protein